jgi:3-deoxy-D-arabino-heptulosonate 7-phosphate (DAHP) synthase
MDDLRLTSLNLPGINENKRPLVIAGPCSAETEEQVMTTARQLAEKGFKIFRAGVWKPRTKPGGFEGMGEAALPWLQRVKEETGMLVSTEVAMPKHVEASLKAGVDLLWVGARTTANPFAMQELADSLKGVDIPVLVKNPVNPDIELWIGALERINGAGITRLGAIHRGFSSIDQKIYRNAPMWHIPIELHRRFPNLPVICDPSHIGGKRIAFYLFTVFIYQKCLFDQFRIFRFGFIGRNRHVDRAQDLLSLVVFFVFLLESSKRLRSKGQHDCDQNNHYGSINNSIHVTVSIQSLFLVGSSLVFHFFEIGSGSCTYRTNIRSFISFVDISTYFTFIFCHTPSYFI